MEEITMAKIIEELQEKLNRQNKMIGELRQDLRDKEKLTERYVERIALLTILLRDHKLIRTKMKERKVKWTLNRHQ